MLVLTRKKGQTISIGDKIKIIVCGFQGKQVRLGIQAPDEIQILRDDAKLNYSKKEI